MPIEIKELHIKATVVDNKNNHVSQSSDLKNDLAKMKKDLLKECVREVMQIMEDKKER